MDAVAFQDRIPGNHCFGCGPGNELGLRIKSFWAGEGVSICRFRPQPHHAAGPRGYLNGGIIATVIDCHGVCTAIAEAYRSAGREVGEGEPIWCVTGSLTVDYRRPTPIDRQVEIRAWIRRVEGRKTFVELDLTAGGESCAEARLLAVRVDPAFLRHEAAGTSAAQREPPGR